MKITYTGKFEGLLPKQRAKFEVKVQKLSKMLERRGEKEVHVVLTQERFLQKVEITINAYDHAMVGVGADADLYTAMLAATEKLEKQVLKMREKWRETRRHHTKEDAVAQAVEPAGKAKASAAKAAAPGGKPAKPPKAGKTPKVAVKAKPAAKVFRVDHEDGRKPMTLEEAMLEIEDGQDYYVYRDAKTDRVSVLLRRGDGHLDLIES
jgi:putative sigma-54 modulation protein